MQPDVLRSHLQELHRELADVNRADASPNPLVGTQLQDIERLMDATPAPAGTAPASPAGVTPTPLPDAERPLPERLENIAAQFEAEHPTLAASSRRLMDLLVKAGI